MRTKSNTKDSTRKSLPIADDMIEEVAEDATEELWPAPLKVPEVRAARPGERGYLLGAISEQGEKWLRLVIQISPDVLGTITGLADNVNRTVSDFKFQEVQVIETAASPYGFHDVTPLKSDGAVEDRGVMLESTNADEDIK